MGVLKHLQHTKIRDLEDVVSDLYTGLLRESMMFNEFTEKELNCLFMKACIKGRTDVAEALRRLGKSSGIDIDPFRVNNTAFTYSVYNGALWVSVYLYLLSVKIGQPINLHGKNDDLFRTAVNRGHTATADWLLMVCRDNGDPIKVEKHGFQLLQKLTADVEKKKSLRYYLRLLSETEFPLDLYIEEYPPPEQLEPIFFSFLTS